LVSPPAWEDPTFLEEVEEEKRSCSHGADWERKMIVEREEDFRRDPEAAQIRIEREYGFERDLAFAIEKHRGVIDYCEKREAEMDELHRWWDEAEDYLAEVAFEPGGQQTDISDGAIRAALRQHLGADDLEVMVDAIEAQDEQALASALSKLQKAEDRYAKRHNAPERIAFGLASSPEALWITLRKEFNAVIVGRVPTHHGFIARPSGVRRIAKRSARRRASRGRAVRVRGSRRAVSRSPGGGSGSDDPGGEPEPAPSRWPTPLARQQFLVENVRDLRIDYEIVANARSTSISGSGCPNAALAAREAPTGGSLNAAPTGTLPGAMVIPNVFSCRGAR
jgi:hypothetical protein